MTYTVIAHQKYTGWDKVLMRVEASSPEEALNLFKQNPDDYDMLDSYESSTDDYQWVNPEDWEVY